MSLRPASKALLAAIATGVLIAMDRYARTSKGDNPWTLTGTLNLLSRAPYMEDARRAINGRFNSVYRSPQVNEAVGGVKSSRHLRGLAADLHPGMGFDAESASKHLWELAKQGKLGPVHKVIWEPTWVHISWRSVTESPTRPKPELGRIPRGGSYQRLERA